MQKNWGYFAKSENINNKAMPNLGASNIFAQFFRVSLWYFNSTLPRQRRRGKNVKATQCNV